MGPGIGQDQTAHQIVAQVMQQAAVPLIVDADALNILAKNLDLLQDVRAPLIITPHLGEMARLCGQTTKQLQQTMRAAAEQFAEKAFQEL